LKPLDLAVLGATGSIGASTLDVASRHPERYRIFALTAHSGAQALLDLCTRLRPRYAVLSGTAPDEALGRKFALVETELLFGAGALERVASDPQCSVVMAAIVGAAGLPSTLAAARAGKRILLANKEALVMAGALFLRAARDAGAQLLPIDSEHNAVFQCLSGQPAKGVRRIVLTASGGPFRSLPPDKLAGVTPAQACAHPNWSMGPKISVDSATMMNKGLEVIEARWLFDLQPRQIEIVIHPQSIVHSLVEYVDGSMIAQMSYPDMRVPIAHALGFPERIDSGARALDLAAVSQLTFERADPERFPCVKLAYQALQAGGTAAAILNAANEVAVEAFLGGRIAFTEIARVIQQTLAEVPVSPGEDLRSVLAADADARRAARERIEASLGRAA
jgi:1-deoxy-D-xylulose-5-phosphate reductoisomerase